ncbi:cupin domain-containing protein [Fontimonas sp. SYSU GA230001]|uniref:cupin domain-containing protein n=1 Tax=Fontimonas sp. SYSU GA230001 TaxID=3142450 RepID=UPI0032B46C0B
MWKHLRSASPALLLVAGTLAAIATSAAEPSVAHTFKDAQLQWGPCPPFLPEGCAIAVLHGDPAQPNVDVFFKVPGGATIPSHTHTSAERMVLVSGELDVSYAGEPTKKLKAGMYAYGPAGKPHSAVCAKGAPCVLFIAFESPLDAMPAEVSARGAGRAP